MATNLICFLLSVAVLAALSTTGCVSDGPAAASTAPGATTTPLAAASPNTPGDATAGEAVYLRVCLVCHQFTGLGLPGAFPPLAGASIVTEADPGKIIRIVLHGLQGPITVNGTPFNSVMPPPLPPLTDKEIADVLTFVRNEWGNQAPPIAIEAVAAIRAKGERATPWTWAELENL
jgi:mono/diheme cytochrome c family protein